MRLSFFRFSDWLRLLRLPGRHIAAVPAALLSFFPSRVPVVIAMVEFMSFSGAMLTLPALLALMSQARFAFLTKTALTLFAQPIALAQIVTVDVLSAVVLA